MQDYVDRFEQYWKEGCSSINYRLFMGSEKTAVLDHQKVNEVVKYEIWTSRFSGSEGFRHGAAVFLDELKQEDPSTGNQVEKRLANLSVRAGVSTPFFIGVSCAAIVFFVLLIISLLTTSFASFKLFIRCAFVVSAVCAIILFNKNTAAERELKDQLDREKDGIIKILRRMEKDK